MLRALAVMGLAGLAWVMWSRAAAAAVAMPEATMPDNQSGFDFSTPKGIAAAVRFVNDAEFGGWFDPAMVMGVIATESSYRVMAYRAEPQINDASYGLMQVLYSTARDRGYDGPPEGLYDPLTNIRIGMAHLKWSFDYLSQRMGAVSEAQWLSSYNAGVGYVMRGGNRAAYVNKVQSNRASWIGVA